MYDSSWLNTGVRSSQVLNMGIKPYPYFEHINSLKKKNSLSNNNRTAYKCCTYTSKFFISLLRLLFSNIYPYSPAGIPARSAAPTAVATLASTLLIFKTLSYSIPSSYNNCRVFQFHLNLTNFSVPFWDLRPVMLQHELE